MTQAEKFLTFSSRAMLTSFNHLLGGCVLSQVLFFVDAEVALSEVADLYCLKLFLR